MKAQATATAVLVAILLTFVGCRDSPDDAPTTGDNGGTEGTGGSGGTAVLDCEKTGIPCALSDVTLAVLERSDEIADNVANLVNDGMSLTDALDWILEQVDVVGAQADDTALRFRVDGGRDVWILTQEALAPANSELTQPVTLASPQAKGTRPAKGVVGQDPAMKKALSIAPFKYEFGFNDDAAGVASILSGTRGYSGNVVLVENQTKTSATVGIANFKGWGDFDVIHVSSHGATICDVSEQCSTVVYTGDTYGNALELLTLTELGVSTARIVGEDRRLFAVGADFFKANYPEGLKDSLVFINACQTLGIGDNDVVAALLGDETAYMGWSQTVQSHFAKAAAVAFYSNASVHGSTATEAWSTLGPLQINSYTNKKGKAIRAELLVETDNENDVRIREVISLLDPDSGSLLTDGAEIGVIGTIGDGENDSIQYRIQIDGVADGQADLYVVHFAVDGLDAPLMTAAEGEAISETSWVLTGELPLGQDAQVGQMLAFESWVELPEGGISEHAATPVIRGPGVEAWEGQATGFTVGILTELQWGGTATVRFELKSENNGIKRFEIVGGSMQWSISGTVHPPSGPCSFQFGPIEVPVVPFTGNRLSVDTKTTPATYSGFGQTEGGEIRVAEECGELGAYSTRPRLIWFNTDGAENLTVSPDGNTITGSNSSSTSDWQWTFTRK